MTNIQFVTLAKEPIRVSKQMEDSAEVGGMRVYLVDLRTEKRQSSLVLIISLV